MKVKFSIKNFNKDSFLTDYLISKGIDEKDIYSFITPDEQNYDNWKSYSKPIANAALRILNSIRNKEKVGILVDADFDGISSATIAYLFLKENGLNPVVYFHDGKCHGLTKEIVTSAINDSLNLLWIPDAGSNDIDYCAELAENNIDVIISDHHDITKPICNIRAYVVNNQLLDSVNKDLSGCGVTSKLIEACCRIGNLDTPEMKDMVAVSIVSDVMSAVSMENRAYIMEGIG